MSASGGVPQSHTTYCTSEAWVGYDLCGLARKDSPNRKSFNVSKRIGLPDVSDDKPGQHRFRGG
jgi:hypothetical protein